MTINLEDLEMLKRLAVDVRVGESPMAILRLAKLIDELQKRVALLEAKRR